MAKEIIKKIKLQIIGGKATPAPPLGPILGQNGIPIPQFCQEFNEKSSSMVGYEIPVVVQVFKDRTFKMTLLQPTVAGMLKKFANIEKGSATPNSKKIGKVNMSDIVEIAKRKLPDLNTKKLESAVKIVLGTAKSLGLEVIDN
ncbi:50S ribosomal protein L11 [Candidatus Dojkabacteria bacterium]|uniref:Large ribosomal subunit protein uL11 n=1 Tax=Candidatus Dojkabacteria bacterium TaxID=2099670 RepID=A0A3M0YYM7_9BACT|nr:MAG: 50S ribosomal protein L11 [Candidatus Dojkabacteria bacterium]